MPDKGHTFTTRAVKRIGGAVRWVEAQAPNLARPPRQGNKQPRDWQGVYEVQSVDTGAETCTVKRYIDSSTTGSAVWTCNYDTTNEPSAGDLGTVLRQGDGTLFFSSSAGLDEKIKVSSNDTTADYLLAKLAAGTHINLSEQNDGGDENIVIAGLDEKIKVSSNDSTAEYLLSQLTGGNHIALTEINDGGDESITIAESGTRQDETEALTLETRASQPSNPETGRIWLRTDL